MVNKHRGGRTIKAAETVFDIIETLQVEGPMQVTELADNVGKAPSTVHGHLTTLLQREYVVRQDGKYKLGLKFTKLGREIRFDLDVVSTAEPTLTALAEDTGEEAWLTIEENGASVPVMNKTVDRSVESVGMIGSYTDIHNSGAGKSVLAFLPEDQILDIIEKKGLPKSTEHTITDHEKLLAELAEIRENGYAVSDEERYEGVRSVFSPIIVGERVYGSIGVAGPANRLRDSLYQEEIPERVMEASNEIELRLRYPKFNQGES
ncbi:IclR family transcriptional regulator [Halomarina salina]|uniref:IclR family transcriptional regulator n=1 Tax=Halomarina salina TaxID=1872699 RepID=A0ABD5RU37_9EURY|nr:IclR family transcriptional regulator [Halomarina salina]